MLCFSISSFIKSLLSILDRKVYPVSEKNPEEDALVDKVSLLKTEDFLKFSELEFWNPSAML